MSFIVLEDQKRPLPRRRVAVFRSIRIVKPLLKLARFTYRSSRFLLRTVIWVVRGDKASTIAEEPITEVQAVKL